MRQSLDRLNGFLGRLVFRAIGSLCAFIALACGYSVWWHLSRGLPDSWAPPLMFGVVAAAAAACVPYCFSHGRTFVEVLDAMESDVPDLSRPSSRKSR